MLSFIIMKYISRISLYIYHFLPVVITHKKIHHKKSNWRQMSYTSSMVRKIILLPSFNSFWVTKLQVIPLTFHEHYKVWMFNRKYRMCLDDAWYIIGSVNCGLRTNHNIQLSSVHNLRNLLIIACVRIKHNKLRFIKLVN